MLSTRALQPTWAYQSASSRSSSFCHLDYFGSQAILDRYRQIRPKILFCDIEALYTGKRINILPKSLEVIRDLSKHGLEMAVLLPSSITGVEAVDVNCPTAYVVFSALFGARRDSAPAYCYPSS